MDKYQDGLKKRKYILHQVKKIIEKEGKAMQNDAEIVFLKTYFRVCDYLEEIVFKNKRVLSA